MAAATVASFAATAVGVSWHAKPVLAATASDGSTLIVTGYAVNDGNSGNDYTVTTVTAAGTITPASLTITATTNTKVYDSTTSATATPTVTGLLGSDTVTGKTEAYTSKDVKGLNGSTLDVASYTVNDGTGGQDYVVTTVTAAGTITPAALAAAKSGLFVVIADNSLIGGDSKPGAPKYLSLKYLMNGIEAYRVIAEGQTAVLDARATMNLAPDDPFKLVEVRYGVGIYNPAKWTDVTQRFRPLVKKNGLNLAKEECDKALSGLPGHAANVPKSLVVHYQYRGRDSFAAFGPGSAVTIGDLVEKK